MASGNGRGACSAWPPPRVVVAEHHGLRRDRPPLGRATVTPVTGPEGLAAVGGEARPPRAVALLAWPPPLPFPPTPTEPVLTGLVALRRAAARRPRLGRRTALAEVAAR